MFHPSPPRRRSAPFAAALAIAAAVTGASAVPASAVTSTTCQYAGSRSLKVCVSQIAASRLTVGGGTADDPYGYEQVRVTGYTVRITNLDPRNVSDIRVKVRAAVYADCISGCDGLLNENLPRDLGVLKRRQRTKRLTVPWRGATTRADRTGRNYQVGSADITWNRHGDPHKFHTDNVCAGTLKFGDVNYGFCDAP